MKKKQKKKYRPLSRSQYEELRTLIEDLDLVPLFIFPPETHQLVREYYMSITSSEKPFDPIQEVSINVLLRNRKTIPKTEKTLILFE